MISKSYRRPLIGAYLFGAVGLPLLGVVGLVVYAIIPSIAAMLFAQPITIVTNPFIDVTPQSSLSPALAVILVIGAISLISGLCCTGLTFGGLMVRDWWRRRYS